VTKDHRESRGHTGKQVLKGHKVYKEKQAPKDQRESRDLRVTLERLALQVQLELLERKGLRALTVFQLTKWLKLRGLLALKSSGLQA
jgi:hypothetical protein